MADGNNTKTNGPGVTEDLSSIIGNMVLAHEMIINDDFKLKGFQDNT